MSDLYSHAASTPAAMASRLGNNQRLASSLSAPSSALAQVAAPATASGLSFRLQDTDLASGAVMPGSFTKGSGDLLSQDLNMAEPLKIDFDESSFFFNEARLPSEIGEALRLSPGKGLHAEYGTQVLDVAHELRDALPAGNHDLLQSITLELQTNYKRGFVVDFKTVHALGDEHFFGNTYDKTGKNLGNKTVSVVVLPTNLDQNGRVSLTVIDRPITQPMLSFLARFPNQTADTIGQYVTPVNKNEVLLHYSPSKQLRATSCVSLWHAAYQDPLKAPLVENDNGFASMSRELYQKLEAQAKSEISRHISLGDVTSSNFTIEIRALPINNGETPALGAFESQYLGVDENMMVEDKFQQRMTAKELFEKTPIEFTGRVQAQYRKINTGN